MKKTIYCKPDSLVIPFGAVEEYLVTMTDQEWDGENQETKEDRLFDDAWDEGGSESAVPSSSGGVWDKKW